MSDNQQTTAIKCMVCEAEQTHRVCAECFAVDVVVEMGRTVPDCRHGQNTWCSCKVRDLAERMVAAGWRPPQNGRTKPIEPIVGCSDCNGYGYHGHTNPNLGDRCSSCEGTGLDNGSTGDPA